MDGTLTRHLMVVVVYKEEEALTTQINSTSILELMATIRLIRTTSTSTQMHASARKATTTTWASPIRTMGQILTRMRTLRLGKAQVDFNKPSGPLKLHRSWKS